MKRTSNPLRFDRIFYAVSTSMLLATPVETFAFELRTTPARPVSCSNRRCRTRRFDPVSASGLNQGMLRRFPTRWDNASGQAVPDLMPKQDVVLPRFPAPEAQAPDQLENAQPATADCLGPVRA